MGKLLWEIMEGAKTLISKEKVRAFRVLRTGLRRFIVL